MRAPPPRGISWYGMPDSLVAGLEHASTGFTVAFSLELVLKVSGLGLREWSKDPANVFDALVVSVDLLSLVISAALGSGSANLSVLILTPAPKPKPKPKPKPNLTLTQTLTLARLAREGAAHAAHGAAALRHPAPLAAQG